VSEDDPRKTGQIRRNTTKIVQVRITPTIGEPVTWDCGDRGDGDSRDSRARSRDRD
jgi:hypothetical protein